jgi:hypothetical protein
MRSNCAARGYSAFASAADARHDSAHLDGAQVLTRALRPLEINAGQQPAAGDRRRDVARAPGGLGAACTHVALRLV